MTLQELVVTSKLKKPSQPSEHQVQKQAALIAANKKAAAVLLQAALPECSTTRAVNSRIVTRQIWI